MAEPDQDPPPSVTVVIPTYQEADAIDACLASLTAQTYPRIVEVLVVDGRSTDDTRARAAAHPRVRVLDNPHRLQSAALNVGLAAARGEVIVRADGHCTLAPDYVERCVEALDRTGAAMVGGAMTPAASSPVQAGIADAMASRFGAGPARFHTGGAGAWVDTVYLGAYRRADALAVGGYATDVGVNEDAELAHRLGGRRTVWFDPTIRSVYEPRASITAVARQFFRYGLSRAATAKRHPRSIQPRQLAAPAVVLVFTLLPRRGRAFVAYGAGIALATALDSTGTATRRAAYAATLPAMHLSWGTGFLLGLAGVAPPRPTTDPAAPGAPR